MKSNRVSLGILGLIALALLIAAALQWREIRTLNQDVKHWKDTAQNAQTDMASSAKQLQDRMEKQKAQADEELAQLRESVNQLQAELDAAKKTAAEARAKYEKQIADLTAAQRKAAAQAPPVASSPAAQTADTTAAEDNATSKAAATSPMKQMAKMMKNPAMKELVRSQQKTLMDMTYKSLYDTLNLPPDQMAKLKDLLLDKQMNQVDLGLEMMDDSLTPDQRKEIADKVKAANDESDQAVKDLLNDKDYEFYKAYEDTKNERMQLNMFNQSLTGDNKLTTDQEDALTLAMYGARSEYKSLNKMQNPGEMDPSQLTPQRIDQIIQDLKAVNQQYILRAGDILSPDQLQQFKTYIQQQQSMQEMGLRMAAKMFGNDSSAPAAPSATSAPSSQ